MTNYKKLIKAAVARDFETICSEATHRIFEENYEAIRVQAFDGRYFDLYLDRNGDVAETQSL